VNDVLFSSVNDTTLISAVILLCGLSVLLFLTAAGLPLTSAALLFAPSKRVKVFRDKFGQQTATLCLLTGFLGLLCLAACIFVSLTRPNSHFPVLTSPLLIPLAGAFVLAGLLALVYRAAWQGLKHKRVIHASIGAAATLAAWAAFYLFIASSRQHPATPSAPAPDLETLILSTGSWIFLFLLCALSLTLAGALSSLYLILRRKKDDFGRDYYNYALKLACKWALFSAVPVLAFHAWLTVMLAGPMTFSPAARGYAAFLIWDGPAAALCLLIACVFWALVLKNQNPLRLKLLCIVATVLTWAAAVGMMAGYANLGY